MNPLNARVASLGLFSDLQGALKCYGLVSGRVLQRKFKDAEVFKIPANGIKCIKYIAKKQKEIRGLTFGDRKIALDQILSTGVTHDNPYR